jgi:hypothetical protein
LAFYFNLGELQNCSQLQSNVSCGGSFFSLGGKVCQWKNNVCEAVDGSCNMADDEVTCKKLSSIISRKCTFFNSNKTCGSISSCLGLKPEDCSRGLTQSQICYLDENTCRSGSPTTCRGIYVYFFYI